MGEQALGGAPPQAEDAQGYRSWVWYSAPWSWDDAPDPYKGGSNFINAAYEVAARPVRLAFGFQRANEDWGEASWTAGDLR